MGADPEGGATVSTEPGRVKPTHIEAEETVVSCGLVDPESIDSVVDLLRAEHFEDRVLGRAYAAMVALRERSETVNLVSVRDEMAKSAPVEHRAVVRLADVLDAKPLRLADAVWYAKQVREGARRRALVSVGRRLVEEATAETEPTDLLIDRSQAALLRLLEAGEARHQHVLGDVLKQSVANLEQFANTAEGINGVPIGFRDLDMLIGGWQRGTLNMIAARPRRGKSVFCAQVGRHAAGAGRKVLAFTLEMQPWAVGQRILLAEARVDKWSLRSEKARESWERVSYATGKLKDLPLWLDDRESPTLAQITAAARRMKSTGGLDLLIVDYLQRCPVDPRVELRIALGNIAKGLKSLSMSLDIAVLTAVQLNRQGEKEKPNLGQLKDCGDLEQEADVIGFLYPHELPGVTQEQAMEMDYPPMDLWIEKHRNGASKIVELTLERRFTRFAPREREET
jgi:replicative DNA helicase